ncbi:MAG: hypothetical protein ABIJ61_02685 [bacterium]
MEKVVSQVTVIETEDGFRIEVKGKKLDELCGCGCLPFCGCSCHSGSECCTSQQKS